MAPRPPEHPRPWGKIVTGVLLSCLCLLLCYCSGLWSAFPPLRNLAINRVDWATGRVDLLAPAGHVSSGGWLAPDSRHLVIGWDQEMIIWDLEADERIPLSMKLYSMGWLNDRQFVVRSDPHFYVVDAATGQATTVPEVPPETYRKPGGFSVIAPLLQRAEAIYSTQGWGGDRLFIYADGQWSMVVLSAYDFDLASPEAVDVLLATIPHTPIARPGHETPEQITQRLTSPDGQYRARQTRTDVAVIETQDGTPVARIFKYGWIPVILGWAPDSSGIYVQFWIRGATGAVLVPEKPLFKLSPLTPAEARWQLVRRVATGGAVVLAVAGAGWWWRRRQRRGRWGS